MALSVYDEYIFNTYAEFYLAETRSLKGWEAVKRKAEIALAGCLEFVKFISQEDKEKLLKKKSWEDQPTYTKRFELFFRDNSNMRHYAVWDDMMEACGALDEEEEVEVFELQGLFGL